MANTFHRINPLNRLDLDHVNRLVRDLNNVLSRISDQAQTKAVKLTGDLDANGFRIKNLGTPGRADHAMTLRSFNEELVKQLTEDVGDITSEGGFGIPPGTPTTSEGDDGDGGVEAGFDAIDARTKEVEIDFGSTPTRRVSVVIPDDDAKDISRVVVSQSGNAPTGKSADESEMDRLAFAVLPADGSFTLEAVALEGAVVGNFKAMYIIAS